MLYSVNEKKTLARIGYAVKINRPNNQGKTNRYPDTASRLRSDLDADHHLVAAIFYTCLAVMLYTHRGGREGPRGTYTDNT
jgi:hypothetical protein